MSVKDLEISKGLSRAIDGQNSVGICVVQDGKISYVNNHLVKLIGWSKEELLAMTPKIVYDKIVVDKTIDYESFESFFYGRIMNEFVPLHHKNKKKMWFQMFGETIDYLGKPANFFIFVKIPEIEYKKQSAKKHSCSKLTKVNIKERFLLVLDHIINHDPLFKQESNLKELFGSKFDQLNQIYKLFNKDLFEDLRTTITNFIEVSLHEINKNL